MVRPQFFYTPVLPSQFFLQFFPAWSDPSSSPQFFPQFFPSGRASSLKKGLEILPANCPGIMVLLGDQPLITCRIIDELLSVFREHSDCWIASAYQGKRGNPVIIPERWFPQLFRLNGDDGPNKLLSSTGLTLHLVDIGDPAVRMDVDTPEDYDRLLLIQ